MNSDTANNLSVIAPLLAVLLMVLSIYILDRRWRSLQTQLAKVTGLMNESHAFSLNLVRHFMSSFKVERYQFRGMQAKQGGATIEFEDLSLELPNGKRVLEGVTGNFHAGRMCAIMGPSGAGKTTFMNVLCGKATYGRMGGSIRINGQEANVKSLESRMGFVPQDDIVHQELTVREQIQFSAKLRGRVGLSEGRVERITEDVLNVMQIDHIQNSIVGGVEKRGISGGQRKRVNIGLELAAEPTLLFLDEPTSGLDSTSSLSVCSSLKKMCQLGMTSIMVIHQPRYSLFTLFDDVLLLGKGGKTVYLGPSAGAKPYFESLGFEMPVNENPADWFMDVISGEVPNDQIPNFKPEMLFDMWREKAAERTGNPNLLRQGSDTRLLSQAEERAILSQKLQEAWEHIDVNHDGVMQADELKQLLAHCSSIQPQADIVRELMDRMAGDGAREVTKYQFLDYLCSLSADVANDQTLARLDAEGITGLSLVSSWATRSKTPPKKEADQADAVSDYASTASSRVDGDVEMASSEASLECLSRETPGFFRQLRILMLRRLVQWWRMNRQRSIFLAALTLGGVTLAVIDRFVVSDTPRWDAMSFLNLHTALALLLAIFCLQVFGNDQPVFWRESSSGMNVFAYFQSRLLVNSMDIIIQTFLFTAVYYLIRQPGVAFWKFFLPFGFTAYAASGWGYLISTIVPPRHGPFIVSLIVFVICGLLGNPSTLSNFLVGGAMEVCVSAVSITRWSVQMSFAEAVQDLHPHPVGVSKYLYDMEANVFFKRDWGFGTWWTAAVALMIMGTVLRLGSFLGLRFTNRDKQV
mmetsp:Transcript_9576/g.25930  ORF Transcript_9576/g.25930 Transcript_9576/m.25930 type:complete len:809 (-) Transcript_9576:601-3027(-)